MITSEDKFDILCTPSATLLVYSALFVYVLSRYRFNFYLPITRRRMEGLHLMMLVNNNI